MDLSQFEDEDEGEQEDSMDNQQDDDLDLNEALNSIILRSKKRQEEFTGMAPSFEAILAESAIERKEKIAHWI